MLSIHAVLPSNAGKHVIATHLLYTCRALGNDPIGKPAAVGALAFLFGKSAYDKATLSIKADVKLKCTLAQAAATMSMVR